MLDPGRRRPTACRCCRWASWSSPAGRSRGAGRWRRARSASWSRRDWGAADTLVARPAARHRRRPADDGPEIPPGGRGDRLDAAGPRADRRDAARSTCSTRRACRSSGWSRTWRAMSARIAARCPTRSAAAARRRRRRELGIPFLGRVPLDDRDPHRVRRGRAARARDRTTDLRADRGARVAWLAHAETVGSAGVRSPGRTPAKAGARADQFPSGPRIRCR